MKQFYTSEVEEVIKELGTSEAGLTSEEAKDRLEKNGKNALEEAAKRPMILRFFALEQWGTWGAAGTPGLCGARGRDSARKDGTSEWKRSERLFE